MAGGKGPSIDLFPFLSIMCCTIGTLTLVLSSLVLQAAGLPDPKDAPPPGPTPPPLPAQIAGDTIKLSELNKLIADALAVQQALEQARAELERLKQQQTAQAENTTKNEKEAAALLQDLTARRKRAEELQAELKRLQDQTAKLEAELAAKPKEPDQPVKQTIKIGGGGSGAVKNLKPTFVECTADALIIYDQKNKTIRIRKDDIATSTELKSLIRRITANQSSNAIIEFLIRPDGIKTYDLADNVVSEAHARHGKLPIPGDGPIDLSVFDTVKK